MSYATPSDLPPRPSQPRDGNQLRNNVNGRENLVVCSFYTRIGACRHGENCSKKHIRPNSSNTIMLANLYQNPKVKKSNNTDNGSEQLIPASESGKTEVEMANEEEPQEDKEEKSQQQKEVEESEDDPTEEEIQEYFDQFYADVFVHISQMRPIYKLSVCENQNDHLNGNVYVQFFSEEDAGFVNRQLNSEWFNERPVYSELSPVSDFEEAHCRAYDNGGCDHLIGTRIPNLRAMRREQVPLWVALILKSQDKCSIVPPKWLNVAFLKEKYDDEVRKPLQFSDLPWNWLEVSKILLDKASDDLSDPVDQLRSVIQDLREVRLVKTKKGFKELNESNIQLNGLSLLEINEIRPFVIPVMNKLRRLHETTQSNYSQAQDEEMEDVSDEEY
ncbi:DNA replication complex GINS protein PSF2 [Candida tropicalis]